MAETSDTSWDEENLQTSWETSMEEELKNLPSLSLECSIYRVPRRLCQTKENAYIPKIISIGPLHHGGEGLEAMEEHKMRYLRDFIKQTNEDLKFFVNIIRDNEEKLRGCYVETIELSSEDFIKIILVDAAFIIEVLLKSYYPGLQDKSDRIFNKPWLIHGLWLDMLLLENQLPFFILESLFDYYKKACSQDDGTLTISMLTAIFFRTHMEMKGMDERWADISSSKVKLAHFVHLVRYLQQPLKVPGEGSMQLRTLTTPNITKLHQAGVKFKVRASKDLFDIQFKKGILEIPKFILSDEAELSIRNSLAFEQCHFLENHINDYVIILTHLINSPNDVDLLVKSGILESRFSHDKEVSILLNKLVDGTILEEDNFYFATLSESLNAYYKRSWHKWKATLRQKYFRTPWASISVIVGVVLLILTFIQTACSVIPLFQNQS